MQETLNRIFQNIRKSSPDQKKKSTFNCSKCKDTSWILDKEGNAHRCSCYEKALLNKTWEAFGVKAEDRKKLNDYKAVNAICAAVKEKAKNYILSFNDLGENNNFALMGQSGAGKSHISIALGVALIDRGHKAIYMPYIEALRELKANVLDQDNYNKLFNKYSKTEILIIDDLFKDKFKNGRMVGELNEADMKHIYPILNYRYNNKLPVIFSTECNIDNLLNLDEALAGRLLERCGNNITVFSGREYNYRLRNLGGV